jgi:hypothetical protein
MTTNVTAHVAEPGGSVRPTPRLATLAGCGLPRSYDRRDARTGTVALMPATLPRLIDGKWRASSGSAFKEQGLEALCFYTRVKAVAVHAPCAS